jgi:tetratricopeptide (TPR) repeat protein
MNIPKPLQDALTTYSTEIQSIAGLFAIITGLGGCLVWLWKRFSRDAESAASSYPIEVLTDPDDLAERLWAKTRDADITDHAIPYLRRFGDELDTAFLKEGRVLLRGRSKCGKTREALELLRRHWSPETTVLRVKPNAWLDVPLHPPVDSDVGYKQVVIWIDDVHQFCRVGRPSDKAADQSKRGSAFPERLDKAITYFERFLGSPHDVKVVATVRSESPHWEELDFSEAKEPWSSFTVIEVPALTRKETTTVIGMLADVAKLRVDIPTVDRLAEKNDGTFLPLIWAFRDWKRARKTVIEATEVAEFVGKLTSVWEKRFREAVGARASAVYIYASLDLLTQTGIELHKHWVLALATALDGGARARIWRDVGSVVFAASIGITLILKRSVTLLRSRRAQRCLTSLSKWLAPLFIRLLGAPHLRRSLLHLVKTEVPEARGVLVPYEGQVDGRAVGVVAGRCATQRELFAAAFKPTFWGNTALTILFQRAQEAGQLRVGGAIAEELGAPERLGEAAGVLEATTARRLGDVAAAMQFLDEAEPFFSEGVARLARDAVFHERGHIHEAAGRYDDAIAAFTAALAISAGAPHYTCRGRVKQRLNRLDEALKDFDEALWLDPRNIPAMKERAKVLETLGRLDEASAQFDRLIELYPADPDLLRERAAFNRRGNDPQAALRDLEQALSLGAGPAGSPDAGHPSQTNHSDHEARGGETHLALAPSSTNSAVYILRAEILEELGRLEEAQRDFDRAVECEDSASDPLRARASFRLRQKELTSALTDLNRALELDPKAGHLFYDRAQLHKERGDLSAALDDLDRAAIGLPGSAAVFFHRTLLLEQMERIDDAAADWNRVVALAPDVDNLRARATFHRRHRNFTAAAQDFDRAIALAPKAAQLFCSRAEVRLELGQRQEALDDLTRAAELRPDALAIFVGRGHLLEEMERFDEAAADLDRVIELEPTDAKHFRDRATFHQRCKNYQAALDDIDHAVRLLPSDADFHILRATLLDELNRPNDALAALDTVVDLNPSFARDQFFHDRGHRWEVDEHFHEAIRSYTTALAILERPRHYGCRGRAKYKLDDLESALRDLDAAAVDSSEELVVALAVRGKVLAALGRAEDARRDFNRAIELQPEKEDHWIARARFLLDRNEVDAALNDYDEAARLDPKSELIDLAKLRYNRGQFELALRALDLAAERRPRDPRVYSLRAETLVKLQRLEEAGQDFDRTIDLDPSDAEHRRLRAVFKAEHKRYREAFDDLDTAVALEPSSPELLLDRGTVLKILGEHDAALRDVTRSAELKPESWRAHATRAELLDALQHPEETRLALERASELNDNFARDEFFHDRGHEWENRGGLSEAVDRFTAALSANPLPRHYVCRGKARRKLGQLNDALADFDHAVSADAKSVNALTWRALVLEELDRPEEAERDLDRIITLEPTNADPLLRRAQLHRRRGDLTAALTDLEQALRLNPTSDELLSEQSELLAQIRG